MKKIENIENVDGSLNNDFLNDIVKKRLSYEELGNILLKKDKSLDDKKTFIEGYLFYLARMALNIFQNNRLYFINYSFNEYLSDCYLTLSEFVCEDKYLGIVESQVTMEKVINLFTYSLYNKMINILTIKKINNHSMVSKKEDYRLFCEKYLECQKLDGKVDWEKILKETNFHISTFLDIVNCHINSDLSFDNVCHSNSDETYDAILMRKQKEELLKLLNILPLNDKEVLENIYGIIEDDDCHMGYGETKSDLAREKGVSRQFINEIESKSLRKVRHYYFSQRNVH